jgi:two-component system repressor protein LuxO
VESIFLAYDWPGNVRQLQNVIQNVVVLYDGDLVTREMLPPPLNAWSTATPGPRPHSCPCWGAKQSVATRQHRPSGR